MSNENIYNPHVSVDCVVFGFDGEKLKVLLVERSIAEQNEMYNDKKLPGSIILQDEDLDTAASRVLNELTGLKNIYLSQFKSFGSRNTYIICALYRKGIRSGWRNATINGQFPCSGIYSHTCRNGSL